MAIHECYPYLRVSDGAAAIDFYLKVFEATERFRLIDPSDGRVGHAEIELAPGMVVMLSDPYPEMGILPPSGNTGMAIHLHVDDADTVIERARAAGAEVTMEPADQFHGERSGKFRDPYGHEWYVGHSIEEIEPAEMQRRWDAIVRGS